MAGDEKGLVLRQLEEGVATISFNRPAKHNAIIDAMKAEWAEALAWVKVEPKVRVVVIRGEGPSFCSGRDTSGLGIRAGVTRPREQLEYSQSLRLAQLELGKPVIASLRGAVIGAGAEIALAADVRVAATDLKFSLPEVNYGLVADTGASILLTSLIGPARAKWLLMSGEVVGSEDAKAWGLVEWTVAPGELDAFSLGIARVLAAKPPNALQMSKDLVDQVWASNLRGCFHREMLAQLSLFGGDEYKQLAERRHKRAANREGL